jgi:hypothetical protein
MTPARLSALSVVVAVGAVVAYSALLRVPVVRNHPEGYVVAFALATVLGALALRRSRRWYAWLASRCPMRAAVRCRWPTTEAGSRSS